MYKIQTNLNDLYRDGILLKLKIEIDKLHNTSMLVFKLKHTTTPHEAMKLIKESYANNPKETTALVGQTIINLMNNYGNYKKSS